MPAPFNCKLALPTCALSASFTPATSSAFTFQLRSALQSSNNIFFIFHLSEKD
jgi:hypothetical protein